MPEELYNTPSNNSGVASGWLAVNGIGQQDQALQGMNEESKAYIETLAPAERQKAIDEFNAPLSGMEVYEALKQSQDFKPTHEEYTKYLAYDKEHKTSVLEGLGMLGEGMSAVMGDLGKAAGAVIDHPMSGLAKAPASLIEAFAQGTRNLYGMVAQSASPDSVLFKMKNALAGDGTVDGYNQFLEARKFNKHSARLAAGEDTLIMDKDVIDHDMTLAMSYIADPTLFIPFGAAASAGMKAIGMGEKIALLGSRAASIKAAVIGGGLKWGVGAPIEALASVTRGTIERGAALGGAVLETTTGISAAELKATAKLSAAGTTTASALGGHIPIISDISNVYLASGAARGFGEAIGAVGEQIQKQGFKRGYNSFAKEALLQTKGLSPHAQGLLKVLDAVDPMFSYGYGTAVGAGHGALIGGTLGYLNSGEEGMYHGMGAGIALGATGAVGGRMFADVSGGTKMARAEIQGGFVIENMRADKHQNLAATELYLELATRNGDRAGALQVIGGLDRIAPDMRLILGNTESQKKLLQSKGLNADGHKVDPVTGRVEMRNGKPVQYEAPLAGFHGGEGFTMHTEKDGNGKQQVTVIINTDALAGGSKNVMHHEIFHAVFKTTIMEGMFRQGFAEAILGKFDANGVKVKDSEINPREFKAFVTRELANTVDPTTNKKLAPAELARRLKEFDYHLAEYQKAGTTTKMNPDSAKALNYLVEEFGAHYATQFMKGKPVDYLFHGAEYTGMQGVMDRLHNGFLDFWQGQTGRQNPTFGDFSKGMDATFGPNKGKRTLDQRSAALDYMVQDLLRSTAGKRKGSTNSFDVRTMSPEARNAYFNSSGMDGVRAYYDKNGNLRNVTEAQVTAERLEVGKAIHESLSKLDPKETAGLADADGNFGSSSTLGTKFNDTVLAHLVKEGHISQQLAERIKTVQDIVSGQGSNRVSYLYKGASMETEVGPNSPRVRGAAVPITARETIVVGYKITIKKDGTMSLVMKGLDAKVMDERGNIQWAKPEVRALWQGDRNAFDQSFMEYLSNASKASNDKTRVESSLLPSLAMGDGLGAERRNVMHQFLGMAKRKSAGYINTPIAEIPRGKTSVVTNFTMDTMSPMRSDSPIRYDFNLDNAHSDLSRNFKVSDMDYEKTPQGDVFTHASKYKIIAVKDQDAKLYDSEGKSLGSFKDKDLASVAMEKAYKAERLEVENRVARVQEHQQAQQQNFKVWDERTMEEGRRLGDIFETEEGKAFHHGTTLIRQTREEFYSDNFSKLRQADPDTVMAVTEQIAQRGYALRDLRTKAYDRLQAELAKGKGREYKKARDEYDTIVSHADRYNDILLAYERATRAKTNGQGILDYINIHRRTSTGYDNMAKVFFGDHYDSQFQTGKPVTTVATHGTNNHELLTSREFDPKQSGSRHGAEHDKVGIFLSGETKTSHGYADPKENDFGYRQVRAAIKFNNPLVVDAQFKCYSPDVYEGYMKKVRDGGHDGVIIKNVYDGGSADTVFIVNNDSVKANTAIIDTHIGMERVTRQSEQIGSIAADSDQGSVRYPIQESMPRGKDVRVGSQLGLSWKVGDDNAPKPLTNSEKQALRIVRTTLPMSMPDIWDMLKKSGNVIKNFDWRQIRGPVIISNPDTMIAGSVSMGKTPILKEVKGGPNFSAAQQGEAWAVASKAKQTEYVNSLNDAYRAKLKEVELLGKQKGWSENKLKQELADVSVHMILTRGSDAKVLNNTQGAFGAMTLLKDFVKKGVLTEQGLRDALQKASQHTYIDSETKVVTRTFPTLDYTGTENVKLTKLLSDKFFDSEDTSTFGTRGTFVGEVIGEIAKNNKEFKSKENLAKLKEVFSNPEFKLSKEALLSEIGKSFSEPYTDNIPMHHAFASVEINGLVEGAESAHPAYPHGIRKVGGGQVKLNLFSDTVAIRDMVNHPTAGDLSTTPLAENKLGSNSKGIARAVMKSSSEHAIRPKGEGRIGMNYKVSDEARAYDEAIKRDDLSTAADIARKMAEKKFGMPIIYDPSPRNKRQNVTEKITETKSRLADYRDSVLEYGKEEGDTFVFDKEKLRKELESEQKRWKETYKTPEDEPMPLESRKAGWKQSFRSDMPRTISERLQGLERDFNDRVRLHNQVKEKLVGLEQDASSGGDLFTTGKAVAVQAWHGSPFGKRTSFSKDMLGSFTQAESAKKGHFFAGDISTASVYQSKEGFTINGTPIKTKGWALLDADTHNEVLMHLEDEYAGLPVSVRKRKSMESWTKDYISTPAFADLVNDLAPSGYTYDKTPIKPVMYATYLKMNNPFVFDFQGREYREQTYSSVIEQAKKGGHDSVILTNTYDGAKLDNIFVMLSGNENNIKDANFITKSDSGKRISLDKRFDTTVDDIRYKASDSETKPNLKPFEGNFKVSDVVKAGIAKLDETLGRLAKTENLSPTLRDAMKALKDAVRKQDATDEVLIPELREAYDTMVRSIDDQMAGASLTPIDSLKEIQKALKPLDKKIQKNSERVQKNARDAMAKDMAEGSDIESEANAQKQSEYRQSQNEGADIESEQALEAKDKNRGNNRFDMEEGADVESQQAYEQRDAYNQDQNEGADVEAGSIPKPSAPNPAFPYPAPAAPAGLPSYKPSGKPALPKPPVAPATPSVTPSGKPAFPRPPTAPVVPKGSIAPPAPVGTPAPSGFPKNLPASKPLGKLEGWRGWTLEKGLNGGFWKNAVGWMIIVQADKFKVYNPQKAMLGIYQDIEQAKRRVQRAEPKQ